MYKRCALEASDDVYTCELSVRFPIERPLVLSVHGSTLRVRPRLMLAL